MIRFFLVFIILFFSVYPVVQADQIPSGYKKMAQKYGIPEKIFYSVMMQESSSTTRSGYKPWPWTLNVKGVGGVRYPTRLKAYYALEKALKKTSIVDVGLGQINWHWNGKRFKSTWQALDPYTNLRVAAQILKEEYKNGGGDWWIAVGRYHSPGQKPEQKQRARNYIAMVKRRYQRIAS